MTHGEMKEKRPPGKQKKKGIGEVTCSIIKNGLNRHNRLLRRGEWHKKIALLIPTFRPERGN